MKIPAPDNRKPVTVNLRLDAATYDLSQLYKEYRAKGGDHFATDSQLIAGIIAVFFDKGDNDFKRWLKTQPLKEVTPAPVKVEKKTKKANGVDLSAASKLAFIEEHADVTAAAKLAFESEQK